MSNDFIRVIHVDRVRHLSGLDIELGENDGRPRYLILTGKNGSGKTSLLNAVAGYLESVCRRSQPSELRRYIESCRRQIDYYTNEKSLPDQRIAAQENLASFEEQLDQARHGVDLDFCSSEAEVRSDFEQGRFSPRALRRAA